MSSLRGKLVALLSAGMLFQMGGCSMTDILGESLSGIFPSLLSGFLGGG